MATSLLKTPLCRILSLLIASCFVASALPNLQTASIALPLHTSGRKIVDDNGDALKLGCVNWYGADQKDFIVGGLNFHSLDFIAKEIASFGFNCVRLPWAIQGIIENPTVAAKTVTQQPNLLNATALEALDATITALGKAGLMIILDNHMSTNDWCCSEQDGNGLWYTDDYSEQQWLDTWAFMAKRYAGAKQVIGADLRNELRSATVGGAFLTPTWGTGDPATDWRMAATKAGVTIQQNAPHWLIIVEGLQYATDLSGVGQFPVELPLGNQLVYEAHNYVFDSTFHESYDQFASGLTNNWGYILNGTSNLLPTPVWVGEIGTCHGNTTACVDGPVGLGLWWQYLHRYLLENELNFGYWAIDGTQSTGTGRTWGAEETYGIFNMTWDGVASTPLLDSLTSLLSIN